MTTFVYMFHIAIMLMYPFVINCTYVKEVKEKIEKHQIIGSCRATLTSCQIKCKLHKLCTAFGTPEKVMLGATTECYLVKECNDKYKKVDGGSATIDLYVYRIVEEVYSPPVDGNWSVWSNYTKCSKTCGTGVKTRNRTCDNPPPNKEYQGKNCTGDSTESQSCNTYACPTAGIVKFTNPVRGEASGSGYIQGHVEVWHKGKWGTVCDDHFDDNDAKVICRMGGYQRGFYTGGKYKQPSAPKASIVWLDDLRCTGDELNVEWCERRPWGQENCSPSEDVGIRCTGVVKFTNPILGEDRTSKSIQGHVEVWYGGRWGTVCDDHFDDQDAKVICRMAGYVAGYYSNGKYKQTNAPKANKVWLDDLQCTGEESNVAQCTKAAWGVEDCNPSEDVGIRCTG